MSHLYHGVSLTQLYLSYTIVVLSSRMSMFVCTAFVAWYFLFRLRGINSSMSALLHLTPKIIHQHSHFTEKVMSSYHTKTVENHGDKF